MNRCLCLGLVLAAMLTLACTAQTTSRQAAPVGVNEEGTSAVTATVDDSKAVCTYTNFSRVSGNPEELLIDFGLNTQTVGIPTKPVIIDQKIVMNYYTAKRFAAALQLSVERHEKAFGPIETDIQKRLISKP